MRGFSSAGLAGRAGAGRFGPNHYELAFEAWLKAGGHQYMLVDEHRRAQFEREKVKGFDFLLYSSDGRVIIGEVKGRKFKGKSLEKLSRMECWVTAGDVDGLAIWEEAFGEGHEAVFIFAYGIENYDADLDGREAFEYEGGRYVFFAVRLSDYREHMKLRSPKWQTVTLPAAKFRGCAMPAEQLLSRPV